MTQGGQVEVPLDLQLRALRLIEMELRHALSDIRQKAEHRKGWAKEQGGRSTGYEEIYDLANSALRHRQGIMAKAKTMYKEERGEGLEVWGVKP